MSKLNRRRFLWVVAGAGAVIGPGTGDTILPDAAGQVSRGVKPVGSRNEPMRTVQKATRALGSDVSLTVLHPDAGAAERAVDAALGEIKLIDELMSLYRPQSQLSRLNREGVLDAPHPYLVEVLTEAREMSIRSGGAFDVTVQPLWMLFADAAKAGGLPELTEVRRVQQLVDWRRVEITPARVSFAHHGMAITLNGIAQGFAADKAARAVRANGIQHALLNTGEIGALGRRESGDAWRVGIQHPRRPEAYISLVELGDRCLATSGDYATRFSEDYRHHHLFDPRTGLSPTELSSVSVAAATAVQADALSTASYVLGAVRGLELIEATLRADAFFVLKDGDVLSTCRFPLAI